MTDTPNYGIYIDFTSKTAVLVGTEMVDKIIGCMKGHVTGEKIQVAANTLLALYFPDYDRGDEVWSLGADEPSLEHFKQSIGGDFVIDSFKSDGGR